MTKRHLHPDSPWLLAMLAGLVALGPLSIDMYMPALPAMMRAFDSDISSMHLTVSAYLIGFSVFHLLCGPLADRFGRKPVLLGGTLIFMAASVGCSFSTTVEELLTFRFAQGLGACVGPTLARTITRDIFGPNRAARALSLIAMLMALAPAVAPILGGVMLLALPWPSIFVFLALYGGLITVLTQRYLPESMPAKQSLHPGSILRNYAQLLRDPLYLTVTLVGSLSYAAMITYLASSSFVYIEMFGVPPQLYGVIFLTTVLGYMVGSAASARLSGSRDSVFLILIGSALGMGATLAMWIATELYPDNIFTIIVPITFFTTALGLVLPHAMATALKPFAHIAGTASALLGFIQMSLSAATSALVGLFLHDTPRPMVLTMVIISTLAMLLAIRAYRSAEA
jgi:DHA1 family bicyclomycin/chloramphenicol resistance-like MFS transporter